MAEQNEDQAQNNPDLANSLFPPPPAYYKHFTKANLDRYAALGGGSSTSTSKRDGETDGAGGTDDAMDGSGATRIDLSEGEQQELESLRSALQPPRADWVQEEGKWLTFGQQYTVRRSVSSHLPPLFLFSFLFPGFDQAGEGSTDDRLRRTSLEQRK